MFPPPSALLNDFPSVKVAMWTSLASPMFPEAFLPYPVYLPCPILPSHPSILVSNSLLLLAGTLRSRSFTKSPCATISSCSLLLFLRSRRSRCRQHRNYFCRRRRQACCLFIPSLWSPAPTIFKFISQFLRLFCAVLPFRAEPDCPSDSRELSLHASTMLVPISFGCDTWKFRTEGEREYLDSLLMDFRNKGNRSHCEPVSAM